MQFQDLSSNLKIASLARLMAALQESHTPAETLRTIRRGLAETYGATALMFLTTRDLPAGEYRVLDLQLDQTFAEAGPWQQANYPLSSGGVLASILASPLPQLVQDVDWADDPYFSQVLAGYDSVIAIPFASSRLPMNWAILLKQSPQRFTVGEMDQSLLRSILIGSLLESQALGEELAAANAKIEKDVQELASLQRSLIPCPLPEIAGLEIAASYIPSGAAGGDWYDLFPLDHQNRDNRRWCIFIGDVSGHGLAAAVVMAMTQAILHAHPPDADSAAGMLSFANGHLCQKQILEFVTAFLGVYDPATRNLVYASAGHPPPLLRRSDGSVIRLAGALTYPLGINPENMITQATIQLQPGDAVLLYTDGVTEARSPDRDMFELRRLERELVDCSCRPASLISRLRSAITAFQDAKPPVDDQTLLALTAV